MQHFDYSEFDSPDELGSGKLMRRDFLDKLEQARIIANVPFRINSGYRTEAHNKAVGGVKGSSHTKGCAADISVRSDSDRFKIVDSLLRAGFNRIGIAKTFIHVDNDIEKNSDRIWTY